VNAFACHFFSFLPFLRSPFSVGFFLSPPPPCFGGEEIFVVARTSTMNGGTADKRHDPNLEKFKKKGSTHWRTDFIAMG
jgi:hypothetical protein